jgi:hypothetical protein
MLPVNVFDRPLISDAIRERQRSFFRVAGAATDEALSCPFTPKAVLSCGTANFAGWLGTLIADERATIMHEKSSAAALLRRM